MRKALVVGALAAAVAAAAAAGGPQPAPARPDALNPDHPSGPLLGVVASRTGPVHIARLAARSLEPMRGRIAVGAGYVAAVATSPDGARSAVAVGSFGRVRLLDHRRGTFATRVLTAAPVGTVMAMAWIGRRLVVVGQGNAAKANGHSPLIRIATLDVASGRAVARVEAVGLVETTARAGDALLVLTGPFGRIGPARLLRVDATGAVARAELPRTLAGVEDRPSTPESPAPSRGQRPGLAVDPSGTRAVVVGAGAPAAEVDVRSLTVRYHELDRPSLAGRILRALDPRAEAKGLDGPSRTAAFVGPEVVAVTGRDDHTIVEANGAWTFSSDPAGLTLIDTRSWTTRRIDARIAAVVVAGGRILAKRGDGPQTPLGLLVYDVRGHRLRTLFPSREVTNVQVTGDLALVEGGLFPNPRTFLCTAVVDLRNGRVLHRRGGRGMVRVVGAATFAG